MLYQSPLPESNINRINSVHDIASVMGFGQIRKKKEKEGRGGQQEQPAKRVKDYFKTLARATETSNEQLQQKGIPFRFRVYEKDNKVFIDFINLDENGKIKNSETREITNDDFNLWIDDISNIEGLFFDKTG
jgi:hypothetical protein